MWQYFQGLALVICWLASGTIGGQPATAFQYLSKKDGLSQASVFAIAQDSTGFLWFGTRDGLNRYDGYEFKVYRHVNASPTSLIGDDVRVLYIDPVTKELWVGTLSGVSRYTPNTDRFVNYVYEASDSSSLSQNTVRAIYRDTRGRLWIATSAGLNLYHPETDTFSRFYPAGKAGDELAENQVTDLVEDRDGSLLISTYQGCFRLVETKTGKDKFRIKRLTIEATLDQTQVNTILPDSLGNLWFGTEQAGIKYWNRTQQTLTSWSNVANDPGSLSNNNVRAMAYDRAGNLWVGTFDGLNCRKKNANHFVRYLHGRAEIQGLSDNSIRALFIDQVGSLWVGTYYGGVNHYDESYNSFTNFVHSPYYNSLSENVVSSFAEDEQHNLWIGTEGGGLNYYNRATQQFTIYGAEPNNDHSLSGMNVKELLLDGSQLWVGTFRAGLNRMDLNTHTFEHYRHEPGQPNSLSSDNVYGLHRTEQYLWIVTYGGGLNLLNLNNNQFFHYRPNADDTNGINSDLARVLLPTRCGEYYLGTENGLQQIIRNDKGLPSRFLTILDDEKIYGLQEDAAGNIWIGTFGNGLFCFNPASGQMRHYTTQEGLPGNTVFGILQAAADRELWLSTNNGLAKLDTHTESFTTYGLSNGLKNLEYNFNAYAKTASGELLFGGINGFTYFDPANIRPHLRFPPLVFTRLKQNNKLVSPHDEHQLITTAIDQTEQLTFEYNEANFTIGFAALDYFSPENNRYAYQLEGLDRDWVYVTGQTEVNYAIQRAGNYVFRLRGANSDGVWNPDERQLWIEVLPPYWRRWWAYLLYVTLLGLVGFALIRFIRLRHKLQLQVIDKQRQEELMEVKLRFFTNITHEFRTPLTLILGPLQQLLQSEKHTEPVREQLSLIEKNARRLLNLVNQVLTFRKLMTDHEPMKIAQSDLVDFLRAVYLPFRETAKLRSINYHFQTNVEQQLMWFDPDKLEKVFFNLLSNAFKFTPDGGTITLLLAQKNGYFEVRVQDTGTGIESELRTEVFKRFYEKSTKTYSTIKSSGIGLAISQQMVKLHHGAIYVDENTDGPEKGAVFVVELPYGKAHFEGMKVEEGHFEWESSDQELELSSLVTTKGVDHLQPTVQTMPITAPLLLIVEDNPEVRTYISRIFQDDYRIQLAENGVEGLTKARIHLPDLVISDVMMPEMDGITFCAQLKTDLEISHIPVILLTARTADLFKIEGLRTGADDYVTKPFNPDELKLRVQNMIRGRKEAREKFGRVLHLDPKEISVTSADEHFLESALQVVEEQMDNYDFKVAEFAAALAVSRSLLFTKLKALTGQTPNNFIKTVRLKRAAQLLTTGHLNVNEVAYQVGFKDTKYFSKCFAEQFDVVPSKYVGKT